MLEKEYQYYLDNQQELYKLYKGKYIVIVGEKVKGVFNSEEEAYFDSESKYQDGTFLIQLCEKENSTFKHSYHSRVVFS